jgi:signal transduction histidine kinase
VGASADDLIVPEMQRDANNHWVSKFLYDVGSGAKGWRFEAPLLHRDGSEIFTEMSLTELRRGEGHIINAFIRDITQKRAAEEQLIQAQKMESVGQLTGGIAHDFNNMLTVITGTIEILAEAVKNDPHLARIVTLISEAADRGTELTTNLLAFARKQPLQPVEIDVNTLVNEVGRLLSPTLGRQIEIKMALGNDLWPALVDPGQLSSALVNLAINARDAMPDGGTLTFTTRNIAMNGRDEASGVDRQDSFVVVEVTDTGTGIPEAIRDKIFDPFFSTKETGQGTGLGLSMVFGFAKQSGGNIEVDSEEDRGTTFRLYLPKADADASQLPLEDNLQPLGGTETILCVEDDASVRANVITQLESLGYTAIMAANAAEALAIADGGAEFDLLFTDIVMPGKMNGKQLAERMRLRWPSLRVLLTSGYTDHTIIRDGRLVPDFFFLPKPYRRPQLARMLRRCLDAPVVPSPPRNP